ncbi:hypothetical protein, partial [Ammonifex thiophilus]
ALGTCAFGCGLVMGMVVYAETGRVLPALAAGMVACFPACRGFRVVKDLWWLFFYYGGRELEKVWVGLRPRLARWLEERGWKLLP